MRRPDGNLIMAEEAMREMLSFEKALGDEIEGYLVELAANPFAPELLEDCVDNKDGSYYHQLPSGCFVFWEIVLPKEPLRFGELKGITVRVTGACFDLAAG